jgi:hypothetical protein
MPSTRRGAITLAEERPRTGRARTAGRLLVAAVVVAVLVAGYLGVRGMVDTFGGPKCQATALGQSVTFTPEQMGNAATIVGIAMKRGLPARAATIAVATSLQESKLRNIRYGDRDSVGLFQQRPSQGWGTTKQILDPDYATNAFYDELIKIHGYQGMEITKVAQRVQKSAFPEAYAEHEHEGRVIASAISGHSPRGLACRLDDAQKADRAALLTSMKRELGVTGSESGSKVVVAARDAQQAWGVAAWTVAKASDTGVVKVSVDGREWTRGQGKGAWSWPAAKSSGSTATSVTISFAP